MSCYGCGAVVDAVWRWCPVCGRELVGGPAPTPPERREAEAAAVPAAAFVVEWSLPATRQVVSRRPSCSP